MKNENEVIMLILSFVAFAFTLFYKKEIKQVRGFYFLYSSFLFFLLASISTVLEAIIFEAFLNVVEHLSYAISILFMMYWMYKYLFSNKNIIKYD